MKRCASSASDISSENSATGRGSSLSSATFSAMFVTSADLPIDGRAAMMIRLPGWKPPVIASRSAKPEARAGQRAALGARARASCRSRRAGCRRPAELLLAVVVRDLEDRPLGALDDVAGLALAGVDARLDLVRRVEQLAQSASSLDDLRVAAHVADAGDRGDQLADRLLAAGLVELAARAQVLDDAQDVDRLARREERRASPRRSGGGARGRSPPACRASSTTKRVVRPVGQQDRAEHGLLGLDRVRRDGPGRGPPEPGRRVVGRSSGERRVNRAPRPDVARETRK